MPNFSWVNTLFHKITDWTVISKKWNFFCLYHWQRNKLVHTKVNLAQKDLPFNNDRQHMKDEADKVKRMDIYVWNFVHPWSTIDMSFDSNPRWCSHCTKRRWKREKNVNKVICKEVTPWPSIHHHLPQSLSLHALQHLLKLSLQTKVSSNHNNTQDYCFHNTLNIHLQITRTYPLHVAMLIIKTMFIFTTHLIPKFVSFLYFQT